MSAPGPRIPLYSSAAFVDGVQYGRYNSEIRRVEALYKWLEELLDPKHLERLTRLTRHHEHALSQQMRTIMGLLNQTEGNESVHVYQMKLACELHEDGSIGGYEEFAFDGMELIVFDKQRLVYVPASQQAHIIAQIFNRDTHDAERDKAYMEKDCVEQMKMYLSNVNVELMRKVHPQVKVTGHQSRHNNLITKLHCQVYGFYPRDVDVKWVKNGADDVYSEEAKQILPNPDGTYQIRVTMEVTPKEGDRYACHVDHSSLEEPLIVLWEPKENIFLYIRMAVIAVALALTALLGAFVYREISHQLVLVSLRKIYQEKTTDIFVAPHWLRKSWFILLKSMSEEELMMLLFMEDLLLQGPVPYPQVENLKLSAWFLNPSC
ncbi:major histocompatibility complex class I-related gene protein-like [Rhinophrynus dorsalis]